MVKIRSVVAVFVTVMCLLCGAVVGSQGDVQPHFVDCVNGCLGSVVCSKTAATLMVWSWSCLEECKVTFVKYHTA